MSQGGDLPIVEIRGANKIEDQRQRPRTADRPGQPQTPGPQIEPHESDERHDQHPGGHMGPPHRHAECSGCLRPHRPKLTSREDRCRHRRQGKEQIGPRIRSPPPDQHMHQRQREAGGCDHRPNDGDPAEGGQMQNVGRMNLEQRLLAAAGTDPPYSLPTFFKRCGASFCRRTGHEL